MHIIIVGAGPAGLVAYLALKQSLASDTTFTILERHVFGNTNGSATFAGALGIAPNGLRVLKHISPTLFDKVREAGHDNQSFKFQTAGGWNLGAWNTTSSLNGDTLGTVFIERRNLWNVLRAEMPEGLVREGAKVAEIRSEGVVVLEDGTELHGDLIIGADGIRSVVRKAVIAEGEPGREVAEIEISDVGGNLPAAYIREAGTASTVMTFGSTGFVGYGITSETSTVGPGAVWWSTYQGRADPENPSTTIDDPRLVQQLFERHGTWADPVIKKLLADLSKDRSISTGSSLGFAASKVALAPLPRWSKGRVILIGDAAHAVPSSSGQGVSMAFEDVFVLSKILQTTLRESEIASADQIEAAGKQYFDLRHQRVTKVRVEGEKSQAKKGTMNSFEVSIMYMILWTLIKLGLGDGWKVDYDISDLMSKETS